jgi:hypothetical protein
MSDIQPTLADRIEWEWENNWSGEGLEDQKLMDAVLEMVRKYS